jgi:hypothetical protein
MTARSSTDIGIAISNKISILIEILEVSVPNIPWRASSSADWMENAYKTRRIQTSMVLDTGSFKNSERYIAK